MSRETENGEAGRCLEIMGEQCACINLASTAWFVLSMGGVRRHYDWNGNEWFHLWRVSVFNDETKEGGCTTTVHADEPRELHDIHESDGNPITFKRIRQKNKYQWTITRNQSKKVKHWTEKLIWKMNTHFCENDSDFASVYIVFLIHFFILLTRKDILVSYCIFFFFFSRKLL